MVVQHLRHKQVEGGEGHCETKEVQEGGRLEAAGQVEETFHIYYLTNYNLRFIGLVARLLPQRYTHFLIPCKHSAPLSAPRRGKTSKN